MLLFLESGESSFFRNVDVPAYRTTWYKISVLSNCCEIVLAGFYVAYFVVTYFLSQNNLFSLPFPFNAFILFAIFFFVRASLLFVTYIRNSMCPAVYTQ